MSGFPTNEGCRLGVLQAHSLLVCQGTDHGAKDHGGSKASDEQPADVLDRESIVLV